jgi:NAD+ diphosphatase
MTRLTIDVPALATAMVDRREDLREPERLAAAWPTAQVLQVTADGEFPTAAGIDGLHVVTEPAAQFGADPPPGAVLLGSLGGRDYWAMPQTGTEPTVGGADPQNAVAHLATVRTVGPLLPDDEAALATTAVALLGWHRSAAFCGRCGTRTEPDRSGHSRTCSAGHQEFPRLDPAVIVLVHDAADHAVLARQPSWAPGRFSVLAGFTEAGESLEGTVAREIDEEIGVAVDQVEYLGSQPWPFPRSLMIAFAARAPRGAALRPRPGEIDDARWFSRGELRTLLRDADGGRVTPSGITLPGPVSIARRMVEAFVHAE